MAARNHLGEFERNVLWAISRLGSNAYGTTVTEEVESLAGREVSVGALYTTLQRLERKGMIASQLGEATPERGGRAKRYFNLTSSGELALDNALNSIRRISSAFLVGEGVL